MHVTSFSFTVAEKKSINYATYLIQLICLSVDWCLCVCSSNTAVFQTTILEACHCQFLKKSKRGRTKHGEFAYLPRWNASE